MTEKEFDETKCRRAMRRFSLDPDNLDARAAFMACWERHVPDKQDEKRGGVYRICAGDVVTAVAKVIARERFGEPRWRENNSNPKLILMAYREVREIFEIKPLNEILKNLENEQI